MAANWPVPGLEHERLARDVLTLASDASMPSTYWLTDARIARAAETLDMDPATALRDYYGIG